MGRGYLAGDSTGFEEVMEVEVGHEATVEGMAGAVGDNGAGEAAAIDEREGG